MIWRALSERGAGGPGGGPGSGGRPRWMSCTGESCLATAQDWGLERTASLFRRRPIAATPKAMRGGPGRPAPHRRRQLYTGRHQRHHLRLRRQRPGTGRPGRPGRWRSPSPRCPGSRPALTRSKDRGGHPPPAHLLVQYHFWYLTWAQLESKFSCWQEIEDKGPHMDRAGDLCGPGGWIRIKEGGAPHSV